MQAATPRVIAFAPTFLVPDFYHPERIDWRRLKLSITFDDKRASFEVLYRRKADGRHPHDLFACPVFGAHLDRVLEDILRGTAPSFRGEVLHRPLNTCTSRGYGDNGKRSPGARYMLPAWISDELIRLSAHQVLALHKSADIVASELAKKQSGSCAQ